MIIAWWILMNWQRHWNSILSCVNYSLMLYDLCLQPRRSEPAPQISFAVMMAGALPHPGSAMGTMTVATWVMKTRGMSVVGIFSLPLMPSLLTLLPSLCPHPLFCSFLLLYVLPSWPSPLVCHFAPSCFPHPLVIQDADGLGYTPPGEELFGRHWQSVPGILFSCWRSPIQGADIPDFSCLTRYFVHASFLWLPGSGWIRTLTSHQCVLRQKDAWS